MYKPIQMMPQAERVSFVECEQFLGMTAYPGDGAMCVTDICRPEDASRTRRKRGDILSGKVIVILSARHGSGRSKWRSKWRQWWALRVLDWARDVKIWHECRQTFTVACSTQPVNFLAICLSTYLSDPFSVRRHLGNGSKGSIDMQATRSEVYYWGDGTHIFQVSSIQDSGQCGAQVPILFDQLLGSVLTQSYRYGAFPTRQRLPYTDFTVVFWPGASICFTGCSQSPRTSGRRQTLRLITKQARQS